MKCYNCDREITDGLTICPYCHMKQRKDSTAKFIPANNQTTSEKAFISINSTEAFHNDLPSTDHASHTNRIQSRPDNVDGHINPVRESKKGCNNGCKYSIAAIAIFFGIGIIITAFIGMMGRSANNYSSDNSVPPDYTLSTVPTLPILTTTAQHTWKPVVTVARATTIQQRYAEPTIVQNQQDPDLMYYEITSTVDGRMTPLLYRLGSKIEAFEFYNLGREGADLEANALAAIYLIEPLSVSPRLGESKKYYLLAMRSMASAGNAFSESERAYNAGDSTKCGSLVIAGKNRIDEADKWMVLAADSLPVG